MLKGLGLKSASDYTVVTGTRVCVEVKVGTAKIARDTGDRSRGDKAEGLGSWNPGSVSVAGRKGS